MGMFRFGGDIGFSRWMVNGAMALAVAVAVSGCAKDANIIDDIDTLTTSSSGLSATEARILDRQQRYAELRVRSAAIGGALGAVLAGAGCALAVEDNKFATAAACAAAGGAAGAAGAYLVGAYYARMEEVAEDRRDTLQAQLASARQAVADGNAQVREMRQMVKAERTKLTRLNREYRAGRITQQQFKDQIDRLDVKVDLAQKEVLSAESDVRLMEATIKDNKLRKKSSRGLSTQFKAMKKIAAQKRRERDALLKAVATLPPEIDPPKVNRGS